jgi:hypothetical protein
MLPAPQIPDVCLTIQCRFVNLADAMVWPHASQTTSVLVTSDGFIFVCMPLNPHNHPRLSFFGPRVMISLFQNAPPSGTLSSTCRFCSDARFVRRTIFMIATHSIKVRLMSKPSRQSKLNSTAKSTSTRGDQVTETRFDKIFTNGESIDTATMAANLAD